MLRPLLALALIGSISQLAACESEPPPDPAFDVGFMANGAFIPIDDGQECAVFDAIQGGYWIMPTMRVAGMTDRPNISCLVIDYDDNERVLADLSGPRTFRESDDGDFLQLLYLLSVNTLTTPEAFMAIDGHAGLLSCTASNGEVAITREAQVTLRAVVPGN